MITGAAHIADAHQVAVVRQRQLLLGNVKWHYDTVVNVLPKIEMICVNEWWWSTSCEWADVVFAVDAGAS